MCMVKDGSCESNQIQRRSTIAARHTSDSASVPTSQTQQRSQDWKGITSFYVGRR